MVIAANLLRERVLEALRTETVALAAGVDRDLWARDVDEGGHVFENDNGFIGARNRGRMPFMSVTLTSVSETQQTRDGGELVSAIEGMIHVGGADQMAAQILARSISLVARRMIRATAGEYLFLGNDREGEFERTPLGHALAFTMDIRQTVNR